MGFNSYFNADYFVEGKLISSCALLLKPVFPTVPRTWCSRNAQEMLIEWMNGARQRIVLTKIFFAHSLTSVLKSDTTFLYRQK